MTSDTETGAGTTPEVNVPARILGWDGDGAKVEFLTSVLDRPIGFRVSVDMRPDRYGNKTPVFLNLRDRGLRVGGAVELRKLRQEGDQWLIRDVEELLPREAEGRIFILQDAATCILPPRSGVIVDRAVVANIGDSYPVNSVSEAMYRAAFALDQPTMFGPAGIVFCGTMKDGTPAEYVVSTREGATPEAIVGELSREVPDAIKDQCKTFRTKRPAWRVVPLFMVPIAPERRSRMSALAANHSYGSGSEPLWTRGPSVLGILDEAWHVLDGTPQAEGSSPRTMSQLMYG